MTPTPLYRGRFLGLYEHAGWEFCSRSTGANVATIVAVNDAGELLLTEQFRVPLQAPVIELPAGLVGDEPGSESEGIMVAAGRELEEETGYSAETLEPLTEGPSSAGMSDETLHFVRARKITRVGTGGGTGDENITVHKVPVDQVPGFLASCQKRGARTDPKIFAALWFLSQDEA